MANTVNNTARNVKAAKLSAKGVAAKARADARWEAALAKSKAGIAAKAVQANPAAAGIAAAKTDDAERTALKAAGKSIPAALTGRKPASKAKAAKPAKASAKPAAKPVTLAKAIAAKGGKPTAQETKDGPLVTGAKATIIGMIETAKAGVTAAEIAKKLGWPRAGGTISRAIALAPFKVRKERVDGTLRYFAA
jgi:hypothetical protein